MQNIQDNKRSEDGAQTFLAAEEPGRLKFRLRRKGGIDTVYTKGKGNQFYTEIGVNGNVFELQVSARTPSSGLVHKTCGDACQVPKSYDGQDLAGTMIEVKQKMVTPLGFSEIKFDARTFTAPSFYNMDDSRNTPELKTHTLVGIERPQNVGDEAALFSSEQSGWMGLGPYTSTEDGAKEANVMHQLTKVDKLVDQNIVLYDISMQKDENGDLKPSWMTLGSLDSQLKEQAKFIDTAWNQGDNQQYFTTGISKMYFEKNGDESSRSVIEDNVTNNKFAIFDPQVDYMYIDQLQLDSIVSKDLIKIYGEDLKCTSKECHFEKSCDDVKAMKTSTTIGLTLGEGSSGLKDGAPITLELEKYLVPGSRLGQPDTLCYLPIFTVEPGADMDTWETWFLGNIFMDKYLVINDLQTFLDSGSTDPNAPLRIGIFEKPAEEIGGSGSAVLAILFSFLFVAAAAVLFCLYKRNRSNTGLDGRSLPAVKSHIDTDERQDVLKQHVDESNYSDNDKLDGINKSQNY